MIIGLKLSNFCDNNENYCVYKSKKNDSIKC